MDLYQLFKKYQDANLYSISTGRSLDMYEHFTEDEIESFPEDYLLLEVSYAYGPLFGGCHIVVINNKGETVMGKLVSIS